MLYHAGVWLLVWQARMKAPEGAREAVGRILNSCQALARGCGHDICRLASTHPRGSQAAADGQQQPAPHEYCSSVVSRSVAVSAYPLVVFQGVLICFVQCVSVSRGLAMWRGQPSG